MILLVGLGNPGPEYVKNRHNVGFQLIDFLSNKPPFSSVAFSYNKTFHADVAKTDSVIFLKPKTFMNKSGSAVQKTMQFYKIAPEHVYVIHDDLDISLGQMKITSRGPQIHNGLSSIKEAIGDNYMKVRIGIENRQNSQEGYRIPGESYVLQNFLNDEIKVLQDVFETFYVRLTTEILR